MKKKNYTPAELFNLVVSIESPCKPILDDTMFPKATEEYWGVYYHPISNKLFFLEFDGDEVIEQYEVVPSHVVFPNKKRGTYGMSDEELCELYDNDCCLEADDLSCFLYFDHVAEAEEEVA